jgi:hypothetical protein
MLVEIQASEVGVSAKSRIDNRHIGVPEKVSQHRGTQLHIDAVASNTIRHLTDATDKIDDS